jgi:flavocytochrome c
LIVAWFHIHPRNHSSASRVRDGPVIEKSTCLCYSHNGKRCDCMKETRYDLIIIGSGFAGLTCAIEAARRNASVLVIEKMARIGGNSIISDGGIAAPNTDLQDLRGITDSPELMAKDMLEAGDHRNDSELVRLITSKAKEAFEWTRDVLGVDYLDRVDYFGGHSVPRCYSPKGLTGRTMIKAAEAKLQELNIDLRLNAQVIDFIDSDGIYDGVTVNTSYRFGQEKSPTYETIRANKAVIIASGGFGHDHALLKRHGKIDEKTMSTNKKSATGELLKKLARIGAKLIDMDQIQLGPWASLDEKGFGLGPRFGDYVALPYGILMDPKTGKRFINELGDRKVVADAMLKLRTYALAIADQNAVDRAGWNLQKLLNKKILRSYPSLKALAEAYDVDRETLEKTIETYNESVRAASDEAFKKPITDQLPLDQPPYYVMRAVPKVHHTMGGVKIDPKGRVQSTEHAPIRRLYAIGEVTGGVHGASRLGSCAVTECVVMGLEVARHLTKTDPE